MSATFPLTDERFLPKQDNIILTGVAQNKSEPSHKEPMPPSRRHAETEDVDDFTYRETMHVLMLASTSMCKAIEAQTSKTENGAANRRISWLMAIFAMVTLMGAGANFLTTSSFAIGGKQQELQNTQKDLERLQKDVSKMEEQYQRQELKLREYEVWIQTTREKLADKGWKLPPIP